jgi:hypothetical protein
MKIWITAPYDDRGIREVDTNDDPTGDVFSVDDTNGLRTDYYHWHTEGDGWHRTREAAVNKARQFRQQRIENAALEIARLSALAPIS